MPTVEFPAELTTYQKLMQPREDTMAIIGLRGEVSVFEDAFDIDSSQSGTLVMPLRRNVEGVLDFTDYEEEDGVARIEMTDEGYERVRTALR